MIHHTLTATAIASLAVLSTVGATPTKKTTKTEPAKTQAAHPQEQPKKEIQADYNRLGEAIKALTAANDQEALDTVEKAKANGGKLQMSMEEASAMVKRAIEKGLIPEKAEAPKTTSDAEIAAKVIKPLAQGGDPFAKEILEKNKTDENQLALTPKEIETLIAKAKEKGILPKTDLAIVAKAIQDLAASGDEAAKAKMEAAAKNGGNLEITSDESEEFVRKAKEKGLIK